MSKAQASAKNGSGIAQSVLDGLQVEVDAYLGLTTISVGELNALAVGDSFTIDRKLGDPIELRLNGVVIAYGELVAVGDHFGIRIQQIADK
ncbi:MAG: hypothetical protein C0515_01240 [Novosphingobium sp.]|nr:hypothetical protein [Novosphingobium sp.]MBX9645222.1 FliM/FliN family flagellar motor C-terminal domain-containing protein [Novosphingobium sp.]